MHELITPTEMARADRLAAERGTPGIELMENAGRAVTDRLLSFLSEGARILVISGAGNNGGDGFVVARQLAECGHSVEVFIHGDRRKIKGDAALALEALPLALIIDEKPPLNNYSFIVDALFGAGLSRDVAGDALQLIDEINGSACEVLSIDLPSGVDGKTGAIRGGAVRATHTVTFFRLKPGHRLLPGRAYCGECRLADIGISEDVLDEIVIAAWRNTPALWRNHYPVPSVFGHKYQRGHTLVFSGPLTMCGAARLTAHAALRTGSGLVTIASPLEAIQAHASHVTSLMLQQLDDLSDMARVLADERINCLALGPGLLPDEHTRTIVHAALAKKRTTVLDAGALSAFSSCPEHLFGAVKTRSAPTVLTPHMGEFAALFQLAQEETSKLDLAKWAADITGAIVVLKGADTVVADPDGRACIADNAPPWLATAGSGDVLTGIVAGLLAQGMAPFEAVSAAVWLHGEAANDVGPGLISSDLDASLKAVIGAFLRDLTDVNCRST